MASKINSDTTRTRRRKYALSWQDVIKADSEDWLSSSTVAKTVVYGGLALYTGYVLYKSSTTTSRVLVGESNTAAGSLPSSSSSLLLDYTSPEGLRMTLKKPFDHMHLNIHYYCAVALVPVTMLQKYLIKKMKAKTVEELSTMTPAEKKEAEEERWNYQQNIHTMFGNMIVVLMGGMAYGGFSMRGESNFPEFPRAMIAFVAPWLIFIAGIMYSARWRKRHLHAFVGNLVVKSCVSVPIARLLGVLLQELNMSEGLYTSSLFRSSPLWMWPSDNSARLSSSPPAMPSLIIGSTEHEAMLAKGYYVGIAAAAVIIGVWALYDAVALRNRLSRIYREEEDKLNQ